MEVYFLVLLLYVKNVHLNLVTLEITCDSIVKLGGLSSLKVKNMLIRCQNST